MCQGPEGYGTLKFSVGSLGLEPVLLIQGSILRGLGITALIIVALRGAL